MSQPPWPLDAMLARLLAREQDEPVRPTLPPETLLAELGPLAIPTQGRPDAALAEQLERLLALTPATTTRRYFNQLFAGRIPAATAADMLVAFVNGTMHTYKIAGPMVLIEDELLRHMCGLVGFERGEGSFAPGGSLSNLIAMAIARNQAVPDAGEHGTGGARLTVYTSALGHYSIAKNAGVLGLGRANVRAIAVDARGRMDPQALRAAIVADLQQGCTPTLINATAGTTVLGEFDPIAAIAEVAEDLGVWLHVDAAYGGSLLLSPRTRELLAGIERADSVTWDAHKMMGVPVTCSVCLLREPGLLARHLDVQADYLFQSDDPRLDPGRRSLQCGRRNDALKLWTAWQSLGSEGYARRVERQLALARYAAERVEADPDLQLIQPPASTNVCFVHRRVPAEALTAGLRAQQRALVGHARVGAQTVVRLVCVDPEVDEGELAGFFADLRAVAAGLSPT